MKRYDRRTKGMRGLRFEPLESRRMLAGNVSASRSGDTLFIRGDNAANEVAIVSAGSNRYTVIGLDTTVNGSEEQTFSGIRNLNIDLRGGNDVLSIADDPTGLLDLETALEGGVPLDLTAIGETEPTSVAGFIFVRTGAGSDRVALSVDTGSFVDIATGAGNDEVAVLGSEIGLHLFVRGEDGADGLVVVDSGVETTLLLEGGRGSDGVLVQTVDVGSLTVNGGRESDFLAMFDMAVDHSLVVNGEQGNDDINVEFSEARFVHVLGGDGHDEIDIDGVTSFGDLIVTAGSGNDSVEVEPNDEYVDEGVEITSVHGALVIDGGSGNDSLEAELVEARSITIIGAAGNDAIDVDGVNVENHVVIIGGAGNNLIDVGLSDDDEFEPDLPSLIGGFLQVITGSGRDQASINDVSVGKHILVDLGAGNDSLDLSFVEADDFILVLLGSGNDEMLYGAVDAGGDETLDGGAGSDDLLIDFRNGRRIRNFERVAVEPLMT